MAFLHVPVKLPWKRSEVSWHFDIKTWHRWFPTTPNIAISFHHSDVWFLHSLFQREMCSIFLFVHFSYAHGFFFFFSIFWSILAGESFAMFCSADYYISHPAFRWQFSSDTKHLLLDTIPVQQIHCSGKISPLLIAFPMKG